MDSILLAIKLEIPPLRGRLVTRPRLVARMTAGQENARLVLVCAPAGFGKTTLLNAWVRSSGRRTAWLSLDEGDNDPARFLAYLLATLQHIDPTLGEDLTETFQSASLSGSGAAALTEQSLSILVNRLHALPDPAILVLDDFHLVSEEAVHKAVSFLLDHLPAQVLLAIASRADPPLPLARLRARGQLVELRQAELRFWPEEAAEFFQQMTALQLSPEQALALVARTEGWAAGLQLAGLALQGQQQENPSQRPDVSAFLAAFSGSSRYVLDYLAEEVFTNQPEAVQTFLLKTSILERLSASLCAEVMADQEFEEEWEEAPASSAALARARQALETLERANLFITPLDDRREWYRYHALFADLLRNRLESSLPDRVNQLHRRASRWFARHGFTVEAIQHAMTAHDYSSAARLVEAAAPDLLRRGEIRTLIGWGRALPPEEVRARPQLDLFYLWARFFAGHSQESLLAHLSALATPTPAMVAKANVLRAFLDIYQGRLESAENLLINALGVLSPDEEYFRALASWLSGVVAQNAGNLQIALQSMEETARRGQETGNLLFAVMALCQLGVQSSRRGQLHQAREYYEKAITLGTDRQGNPLPVSSLAIACLADLYREWGDAPEALRLADQAVRLSEGWRESASMNAYLIRARACRILLDHAGAEQALAKAMQQAREFDLSNLDDVSVRCEQARQWAFLGDFEPVEAWASERGVLPGAPPSPSMLPFSPEEQAYLDAHMHKYEHLVVARLLTARGRGAEVAALLAPHLALMESQGRLTMVIEILAVQALAYQSMGDLAAALPAIERAARMAQAGGFVRILLDEGPGMHTLLDGLRKSPAGADPLLRAYLDHLLGPAPVPGPIPAEKRPLETAKDALSDRELEVLRLLESGLSTEAIAARLVVSQHTVRSHLKSIYAKLDAHSKVEAVARARQLGAF